jgi:SPW repeat
MLWQNRIKNSSADVINLMLGVSLISAPWIFGFTNIEVATRNAWIVGAMIGVTALLTLVSYADWGEWGNLLLGLWVAASPWALSVDLVISETAVRAQAAAGLVIAVLAAAKLWTMHHALHDRTSSAGHARSRIKVRISANDRHQARGSAQEVRRVLTSS